MAKNRYGWQKRAKGLARKEKKEEKIKRRQGKTTTSSVEESPVLVEEERQISEDGPGDPKLYQVHPDMTDKEKI